MFSFFKSSKKSPVVSPTAERKEENVQKNADDFEVIPSSDSNKIYPPFPAANNPFSTPTHPQNHPFNRQFSMTVNYTQSVPFKLNPSLVADSNDNDIWNYKIREMNSHLQRINICDYDFKLERSIIESS